MVREVLAQTEDEKRVKKKKEHKTVRGEGERGRRKRGAGRRGEGLPLWSRGLDCAPSAGDPGLIPGWGTRVHMPAPATSPWAATKTQGSPKSINSFFKKGKKRRNVMISVKVGKEAEL